MIVGTWRMSERKHVFIVDGQSLTLSELCAVNGVDVNKARMRINNGWPLFEALIPDSVDTLEDLTGRQFGVLTVLRLHSRHDGSNRTMWVCRCVCGLEQTLRKDGLLRRAATLTCSCLKQSVRSNLTVPFGMRPCTKCKCLKSAEEFSKYGSHKSWCADCKKERMRTYFSTESGRAALKRYYQEHVEERRALARAAGRRQVENLEDGYIRQLLGIGSATSLPTGIIDLKREQIALHRLARKMQDVADKARNQS